ncbi:MAG: sugar phosphate isomerase/epimerase [Acidimicrobiia bacterium]|nr:sugar phosphate isomerase/epimerase [Acidimicrobiia bacterium]
MILTRRAWLLAGSSLALSERLWSASHRFRLAICNETFVNWPFERMCQGAQRAGYQGIEIAPMTLGDDPVKLSARRRAELRRAMASEGLKFAGLHALLAGPPGLHATTPDVTVRSRTWQHLRGLLDLCADLGDRGVMVFGSGKQRATTAGSTAAEALKRFADGLAGLVPLASQRRVTILIEPLAPAFSDVVNTLGEAADLVGQIGSPYIQTMFDSHNTAAEQEPHDGLIRKHRKVIKHVHLNEMDGRHPGTGNYDFKKVLQALKDVAYEGWVSLEVFDFKAGPEKIAHESATRLRRWESELR